MGIGPMRAASLSVRELSERGVMGGLARIQFGQSRDIKKPL